MKKVLTFALTAILLASCAFTQKISDSKTMTLLVYMAGNNQLGQDFAQRNLMAMKVALGNSMNDCNLLVYYDRRDSVGTCPMLMHIHDSKIDTVRCYPRQSSVDSKVLSGVIDEVLTDWPSEYYGLLLWSHGMGWLPTSKLHFAAPNLGYAQTRTFGIEANPEGPLTYRCMEIEDLAAAIPDGEFDYIVFDACYMGNIEVAYALRNKANYIISSSAEVRDSGFPYQDVTRDLLNGNLMKVCAQIFNYTESQPASEKNSIALSLVKTSELENLASAFGNIVAGRRKAISQMDISGIQCFDRFTNHVFFDLEDVAAHITDNREQLAEFKAILGNCIQYNQSTDYIYFANDSLKVDSYCGLSVFVPLQEYEASGLNSAFRRTDWSKATDY